MLQSGRGGAGKMSAKFEGAVEGWFRNMATFIGAFYLQHPQVEIVGLLQCVGFANTAKALFALIVPLSSSFDFVVFVFAWSSFYFESFLGLLFFVSTTHICSPSSHAQSHSLNPKVRGAPAGLRSHGRADDCPRSAVQSGELRTRRASHRRTGVVGTTN